MKDWLKLLLLLFGSIIIGTLLAFSVGRLMDHYWNTKVLFSKEVNDSTGCYVRIDKHFKVYYIESGPGSFSKFVLFKDGAPTGTFEYASYCESKNDMVEHILNSYYSRNDSPRIYKVYKPCKDTPAYIKDTINEPTFYLGEGVVYVMTPEEYKLFQKGEWPQKLTISDDPDTTSLYTSEYKYGIPEGIKYNCDTSYWVGSHTIDTANYIPADSISSWRLSEPHQILFGTVTEPTHMISISGGSTKHLNLDIENDSLVVSGDMPLTEGAKIFIDFCRKYMKTKIDSLETELKKCNEIKGKANYVTRMGNSSIYDTTNIGIGDGKTLPKKLHIVGKPLKRPVTLTDTAYAQNLKMTFGTQFLTPEEVHGKTDYLTFQMLLDYEKECLADTIKAEIFEGEYLIRHKNYGEILSEKQLSDMGYKYAYRWYKGLDAKGGFMFDNYFVKEVTLKGFISWYKEKK